MKNDPTKEAPLTLEFSTKYYDSLIADTLVIPYKGEDYYAEILKDEPKQVEGGFEYTIRLLSKVNAE
jgi:hypothetical protein